MPTYDYSCENCGNFEQFHSITAKPLKKCPTCGGKVQRLVSKNGNIIFKGSGFYITDNKPSPGASLGDSSIDSKTS
ncbi:MAG: FmdB family transcriptional regulator [Firmicutes bacterium]|mgnify:CR=1 FL=1|nr:FmdB family transcriptional regulator [Bacillota bacterium]